MPRPKPGGRGASNHKPNKAKTTRESADLSPDTSAHIQSKKSRRVEGKTLENPSQAEQAAGKQKSCRYKDGNGREVTSDMESRPGEKARLSNQDSRSNQKYPEETLEASDITEDVDLYRGQEEIEQEQKEKLQSNAALAGSRLEDQVSVAAPECLLSYSQREWKGNTSKSHLIKKGYETIAQDFESLCRVRGDNYCALRATLFQILSQSQKLPVWLQDHEITQWPEQMQSVQDLVNQWTFPAASSKKDKRKAAEQLKCCLELLREKWQEAVRCDTPAEREHFCRKIFVGKSEEYDLLEALKFLMLKTAVQLHSDMEKGSHVPEFCWLLFARDSSKCPRSFFTNHLRHVGFSGGLEQVEMFLLGYSLQQTLQVYRLYKTDTEEFITFYPDDHTKDWPCLSLVTEDDRHYNVPVPKQAKKTASKSDVHNIKPIWKEPGTQTGGTQVTHL